MERSSDDSRGDGAGSNPEPAHADLPERIRAGDAAAAHELAVRFRRGVAVILRRGGVRPAEVEDLGQEVFRIVLEKVREGAVREAVRLPGYVATVARNQAAEAGRLTSARAARDGGELPEVADDRAGALEGLVEREQAALVRRLLDELGTDRDREVLRRVYLAGEEREQICRDLGLSPLQLNRVLYRARERYRALYEEAQQERSR